jgi:hypothetical protein
VTVGATAAVQAAAAIRWGFAPHTFELRSANVEVMARASVVFRPWIAASAGAPTHSWAIGAVSDASRAVRRVEFQAVQAIFEGPPDLLTAHGALVSRDGRGVLISGRRESGKSTLACALWQAGFSLLSDDTTILDLDTMSARPAPRRVSLRDPSRALLGDALWTRIVDAPSADRTDEGYLFHPDEIAGERPRAVRLHAVVFLERAAAARMSEVVRPLPAAQAALAFVPCLNVARRLDMGAIISDLAPFMASVTAYDVRRARLPEMVAAIDTMVSR